MNAPGGGRSVRGGLLLLVAVVAVVLFVPRSDWYRLAREQPAQAVAESDFQLHWAAGQALRRGWDAWDPDTVNRIGIVTGRPYTPFCAANPLVVRLFGLADPLDVGWSYGRWMRWNVVGLLLAIGLFALALTRFGASPAAAAALALALVALNDGTWMGLYYNQTNVLTLLAIVGALLAGSTGRTRTEGVLLAVAALAKTSPALLIVVAALSGRWRTVRAALATGVLLVAFSIAWTGWDAHASWLDMAGVKLGYRADVPPGEFNNSLHDWNLAPNGLLSRAGESGEWSIAAVRAAAWLVTIATLALLGRWASRRRHAPRDLLAEYAVGIAATFLVSSVTWSTHLSLAALPAAWLALYGWRGGRPLVSAAGAAACAVLFLPLGSFGDDGHQTLDILLKADAVMLLFVVLLGASWRAPAGAAPGAQRGLARAGAD